MCSTAKVDLVRSLGADHVIDYTQDDFTDGSRRYDLILDVGGGNPLSRLRHALAGRGTLVIVGAEGRKWTGMARQMGAIALSPFLRQRLTFFVSKHRRSDLEELGRYLGAGQLTPILDRTYSLAEVPEALRRLEAGQARGKIAITVGPES